MSTVRSGKGAKKTARRKKFELFKCHHKVDTYYFTIRGDILFEECFWCWVKAKYDLKPKQIRRTHDQKVIDDRKKLMEKQQVKEVKPVKKRRIRRVRRKK